MGVGSSTPLPKAFSTFDVDVSQLGDNEYVNQQYDELVKLYSNEIRAGRLAGNSSSQRDGADTDMPRRCEDVSAWSRAASFDDVGSPGVEHSSHETAVPVYLHQAFSHAHQYLSSNPHAADKRALLLLCKHIALVQSRIRHFASEDEVGSVRRRGDGSAPNFISNSTRRNAGGQSDKPAVSGTRDGMAGATEARGGLLAALAGAHDTDDNVVDVLSTKLFLKLLQTMVHQGNGKILGALVRQLPVLLQRVPPLGLCCEPDVVQRIAMVESSGVSRQSDARLVEQGQVVDNIGAMLQSIVSEYFDSAVSTTPHRPTADVAFSALASMIGIAVKRGTLSSILQALQTLLQTIDDHPKLVAQSTHTPPGGGRDSLSASFGVNEYIAELQDAVAVMEQPTAPRNKDKASTFAWWLDVASMSRRKFESGIVHTFGKEDYGKLGHGRSATSLASAAAAGSGAPAGAQRVNRVEPTAVEQLRFVATVAVASFSTHTLAISSEGELYSWGNGDRFRLGHGSAQQEELPRLVTLLPNKTHICDIACGLGHTVALSRAGKVFSWGNGSNGRLGNGSVEDQAIPVLVDFGVMNQGTQAASSGAGEESKHHTSSPVKQPGRTIVKIFCGASHSLAIDSQGAAYAWGKNNQGQCGLGNRTDACEPRVISAFEAYTVIDMAGGWEHTLACTLAGDVFAFGAGYRDKRSAGFVPPVLGVTPTPDLLCLLPRQIERAFYNIRVVSVHCGWDHSMAITEGGKLYTWGAGFHGKLGHGNCDAVVEPQVVKALEGYRVVHAEGGCEHSMAICEPGLLFTWGQGDGGRLGHGDEEDQLLPKKVQELENAGQHAIHCAAGDKYSIVLLKEDANSTDKVDRPSSIATSSQHPRATSNLRSPAALFESRFLSSGQGTVDAAFDFAEYIARSTRDRSDVFHQVETIFLLLGQLSSLHAPLIQKLAPMNPRHAQQDSVQHNSSSPKSAVLSPTARAAPLKPASESRPWAAYCVDGHVRSIQILCDIIVFCAPTRATSQLGDSNSKLNGEVQGPGQSVSMPELASMQASNLPPNMRWNIVMCCLFILQANLKALLSHESEATDLLSTDDSWSAAIPRLHVVLQRMVDAPFDSTGVIAGDSADSSVSSEDSLPAAQMRYTDGQKLLVQESANTIRCGFEVFYSSPAARRDLLLHLMMRSNKVHPIMLSAILSRLSEEEAVASLLRHVFVSGNDFGKSQLSIILKDLLERIWLNFRDYCNQSCQVKENSQFSEKQFEACLPSFRRNGPVLSALAEALQTQLLSIWSEYRSHGDTPPMPRQNRSSTTLETASFALPHSSVGVLDDCVRLHSRRVLLRSVAAFELILAQQRNLQRNGMAGMTIRLCKQFVTLQSKLRVSFADRLLFTLIGCFKLGGTSGKFVSALLPSLMKLTTVTDNLFVHACSCRELLAACEPSAKRGTPHETPASVSTAALQHRLEQHIEWLRGIVDALAGLSGKYIAVVVNGPTVTQAEIDLEPLLSSALVCGKDPEGRAVAAKFKLLQHADDVAAREAAVVDLSGSTDLAKVLTWKESDTALFFGDNLSIQIQGQRGNIPSSERHHTPDADGAGVAGSKPSGRSRSRSRSRSARKGKPVTADTGDTSPKHLPTASTTSPASSSGRPPRPSTGASLKPVQLFRPSSALSAGKSYTTRSNTSPDGIAEITPSTRDAVNNFLNFFFEVEDRSLTPESRRFSKVASSRASRTAALLLDQIFSVRGVTPVNETSFVRTPNANSPKSGTPGSQPRSKRRGTNSPLSGNAKSSSWGSIRRAIVALLLAIDFSQGGRLVNEAMEFCDALGVMDGSESTGGTHTKSARRSAASPARPATASQALGSPQHGSTVDDNAQLSKSLGKVWRTAQHMVTFLKRCCANDVSFAGVTVSQPELVESRGPPSRERSGSASSVEKVNDSGNELHWRMVGKCKLLVKMITAMTHTRCVIDVSDFQDPERTAAISQHLRKWLRAESLPSNNWESLQSLLSTVCTWQASQTAVQHNSATTAVDTGLGYRPDKFGSRAHSGQKSPILSSRGSLGVLGSPGAHTRSPSTPLGSPGAGSPSSFSLGPSAFYTHSRTASGTTALNNAPSIVRLSTLTLVGFLLGAGDARHVPSVLALRQRRVSVRRKGLTLFRFLLSAVKSNVARINVLRHCRSQLERLGQRNDDKRRVRLPTHRRAGIHTSGRNVARKRPTTTVDEVVQQNNVMRRANNSCCSAQPGMFTDLEGCGANELAPLEMSVTQLWHELINMLEATPRDPADGTSRPNSRASTPEGRGTKVAHDEAYHTLQFEIFTTLLDGIRDARGFSVGNTDSALFGCTRFPSDKRSTLAHAVATDAHMSPHESLDGVPTADLSATRKSLSTLSPIFANIKVEPSHTAAQSALSQLDVQRHRLVGTLFTVLRLTDATPQKGSIAARSPYNEQLVLSDWNVVDLHFDTPLKLQDIQLSSASERDWIRRVNQARQQLESMRAAWKILKYTVPACLLKSGNLQAVNSSSSGHIPMLVALRSELARLCKALHFRSQCWTSIRSVVRHAKHFRGALGSRVPLCDGLVELLNAKQLGPSTTPSITVAFWFRFAPQEIETVLSKPGESRSSSDDDWGDRGPRNEVFSDEVDKAAEETAAKSLHPRRKRICLVQSRSCKLEVYFEGNGSVKVVHAVRSAQRLHLVSTTYAARLSASRWHHICVQWIAHDKQSNLSFFVDGRNIDSVVRALDGADILASPVESIWVGFGDDGGSVLRPDDSAPKPASHSCPSAWTNDPNVPWLAPSTDSMGSEIASARLWLGMRDEVETKGMISGLFSLGPESQVCVADECCRMLLATLQLVALSSRCTEVLDEAIAKSVLDVVCYSESAQAAQAAMVLLSTLCKARRSTQQMDRLAPSQLPSWSRAFCSRLQNVISGVHGSLVLSQSNFAQPVWLRCATRNAPHIGAVVSGLLRQLVVTFELPCNQGDASINTLSMGIPSLQPFVRRMIDDPSEAGSHTELTQCLSALTVLTSPGDCDRISTGTLVQILPGHCDHYGASEATRAGEVSTNCNVHRCISTFTGLRGRVVAVDAPHHVALVSVCVEMSAVPRVLKTPPTARVWSQSGEKCAANDATAWTNHSLLPRYVALQIPLERLLIVGAATTKTPTSPALQKQSLPLFDASVSALLEAFGLCFGKQQVYNKVVESTSMHGASVLSSASVFGRVRSASLAAMLSLIADDTFCRNTFGQSCSAPGLVELLKRGLLPHILLLVKPSYDDVVERQKSIFHGTQYAAATTFLSTFRAHFAHVVNKLSSRTKTDVICCLVAAMREILSHRRQQLQLSRLEGSVDNVKDDEDRSRSVLLERTMVKFRVLSGKMDVHKLSLTALSNFPTAWCENLGLFPGSGCWYYEVTILSPGLMQIGWADKLYNGHSRRGRGVGDHSHSWAFDGLRCKKWNGNATTYGQRWNVGDVIGCMVDLGSGSSESSTRDVKEEEGSSPQQGKPATWISFFCNGEHLGVAFANIQVAGVLHPAVSLNLGQAVSFNFGETAFQFPPTRRSNAEDANTTARAVDIVRQRHSLWKPLILAAQASGQAVPDDVGSKSTLHAQGASSENAPLDQSRNAQHQRASSYGISEAISVLIQNAESHFTQQISRPVSKATGHDSTAMRETEVFESKFEGREVERESKEDDSAATDATPEDSADLRKKFIAEMRAVGFPPHLCALASTKSALLNNQSLAISWMFEQLRLAETEASGGSRDKMDDTMATGEATYAMDSSTLVEQRDTSSNAAVTTETKLEPLLLQDEVNDASDHLLQARSRSSSQSSTSSTSSEFTDAWDNESESVGHGETMTEYYSNTYFVADVHTAALLSALEHTYSHSGADHPHHGDKEGFVGASAAQISDVLQQLAQPVEPYGVDPTTHQLLSQSASWVHHSSASSRLRSINASASVAGATTSPNATFMNQTVIEPQDTIRNLSNAAEARANVETSGSQNHIHSDNMPTAAQQNWEARSYGAAAFMNAFRTIVSSSSVAQLQILSTVVEAIAARAQAEAGFRNIVKCIAQSIRVGAAVDALPALDDALSWQDATNAFIEVLLSTPDGARASHDGSTESGTAEVQSLLITAMQTLVREIAVSDDLGGGAMNLSDNSTTDDLGHILRLSIRQSVALAGNQRGDDATHVECFVPAFCTSLLSQVFSVFTMVAQNRKLRDHRWKICFRDAVTPTMSECVEMFHAATFVCGTSKIGSRDDIDSDDYDLALRQALSSNIQGNSDTRVPPVEWAVWAWSTFLSELHSITEFNMSILSHADLAGSTKVVFASPGSGRSMYFEVADAALRDKRIILNRDVGVNQATDLQTWLSVELAALQIQNFRSILSVMTQTENLLIKDAACSSALRMVEYLSNMHLTRSVLPFCTQTTHVQGAGEVSEDTSNEPILLAETYLHSFDMFNVKSIFFSRHRRELLQTSQDSNYRVVSSHFLSNLTALLTRVNILRSQVEAHHKTECSSESVDATSIHATPSSAEESGVLSRKLDSPVNSADSTPFDSVDAIPWAPTLCVVEITAETVTVSWSLFSQTSSCGGILGTLCPSCAETAGRDLESDRPTTQKCEAKPDEFLQWLQLRWRAVSYDVQVMACSTLSIGDTKAAFQPGSFATVFSSSADNPSQFTIFGLEPGEAYKVRIAARLQNLQDDRIIVCYGRSTYIDQRTEMSLCFSRTACGSNLSLGPQCMTVSNKVNKKWNTVHGNIAFTSGCHRWYIRIDKCVSKNIFIGVSTSRGLIENYVGSNRYSWGYLANKAIWYNKSKVRNYGNYFRKDDTVGVQLDMDKGTLEFFLNGLPLGVAVRNLQGLRLFPAVALYNKSDAVTIVPARYTASCGRFYDGSVADRRLESVRILSHLSLSLLAPRFGIAVGNAFADDHADASKMPNFIADTRAVPRRTKVNSWLQQNGATMLGDATLSMANKYRLLLSGHTKRGWSRQGQLLDLSLPHCALFGLPCGAKIPTANGIVSVIGVSDGFLWYKFNDTVNVNDFETEVGCEPSDGPPALIGADVNSSSPPDSQQHDCHVYKDLLPWTKSECVEYQNLLWGMANFDEDATATQRFSDAPSDDEGAELEPSTNHAVVLAADDALSATSGSVVDVATNPAKATRVHDELSAPRQEFDQDPKQESNEAVDAELSVSPSTLPHDGCGVALQYLDFARLHEWHSSEISSFLDAHLVEVINKFVSQMKDAPTLQTKSALEGHRWHYHFDVDDLYGFQSALSDQKLRSLWTSSTKLSSSSAPPPFETLRHTVFAHAAALVEFNQVTEFVSPVLDFHRSKRSLQSARVSIDAPGCDAVHGVAITAADLFHHPSKAVYLNRSLLFTSTKLKFLSRVLSSEARLRHNFVLKVAETLSQPSHTADEDGAPSDFVPKMSNQATEVHSLLCHLNVASLQLLSVANGNGQDDNCRAKSSGFHNSRIRIMNCPASRIRGLDCCGTSAILQTDRDASVTNGEAHNSTAGQSEANIADSSFDLAHSFPYAKRTSFEVHFNWRDGCDVCAGGRTGGTRASDNASFASANGPLRASGAIALRYFFASICSEMMSHQEPLLLPVHGTRDTLVGSTLVDRPKDFAMVNSSLRDKLTHLHPRLGSFKFLGRLMGMSILSGIPLPLPRMAPQFWKHLVNERVSLDDIRVVDPACVTTVERLKNLSTIGVTQANFGSFFSADPVLGEAAVATHGGLACRNSIGQTICLSDTLSLSFETAPKYAELIEKARIEEGVTHIAAVRRGLYEIIPEQGLALFTWAELRDLITTQNCSPSASMDAQSPSEPSARSLVGESDGSATASASGNTEQRQVTPPEGVAQTHAQFGSAWHRKIASGLQQHPMSFADMCAYSNPRTHVLHPAIQCFWRVFDALPQPKQEAFHAAVLSPNVISANFRSGASAALRNRSSDQHGPYLVIQLHPCKEWKLARARRESNSLAVYESATTRGLLVLTIPQVESDKAMEDELDRLIQTGQGSTSTSSSKTVVSPAATLL